MRDRIAGRAAQALPVVALSVVVLSMVVLAGCAQTPEALVRTEGMPGQLEPIHAAAFTRDLAVFRVSSNGCTDKSDVKPFITRLKDSAVITLRRLDEDRCASPVRGGVQVEWTFQELGLPPGANVLVNNPYMIDGEAAAIGH
ncbi:MAG: hypothetical protein J0I52_08465 [Bordetella sp.]|nr:hypothetical protein [Bordetella sp.]